MEELGKFEIVFYKISPNLIEQKIIKNLSVEYGFSSEKGILNVLIDNNNIHIVGEELKQIREFIEEFEKLTEIKTNRREYIKIKDKWTYKGFEILNYRQTENEIRDLKTGVVFYKSRDINQNFEFIDKLNKLYGGIKK